MFKTHSSRHVLTHCSPDGAQIMSESCCHVCIIVTVVPEYKPAASLAFFGAFLANRPFLEYAGRDAERPHFVTQQAETSTHEIEGRLHETISGGYVLSVAAATALGVVFGWCCGKRTASQATKGYAPVDIE
jgi:hypothetical protein